MTGSYRELPARRLAQGQLAGWVSKEPNFSFSSLSPHPRIRLNTLLMGTFMLFLLLGLNLVLLVLLAALLRRTSGFSQTAGLADLVRESVILRESLLQRFTAATADMAGRLESTKGDLRQGVIDRLTQGFTEIRTAVETQLAGGRREQTQDLRQAREERRNSLR